MSDTDVIPEVRGAVVLHDHVVRLLFASGDVRDVDLTPYIARGPVFERVRSDPAFFRDIRIENGTIVWANEADIDPETLYYDLGPVSR